MPAPRRTRALWTRWPRLRQRLARGGRLLVAFALCGVMVAAFLALRGEPEVWVSDETEALARVIRSEVGVSAPQHRVHVAWATRNLAAARRQTIAQMACSPCGPQQAGRPVSSRQAPGEADRVLARHVLAAPALLDPTGGATQFVNPSLQDQLAASGAPGYRSRPYRHVRRTWSQVYGWEPYYRLGPELELWGPKRKRR